MLSDDSMLPISLGVYGTWGVGKSSILRLVEQQLATDKRNLIISFDAWLFQDFDEAKSALMTVIAKSLYEASPETLKERAAGFYRRINKLKVLGLAADVGALLAGVPTLGLFTKAAGSAEDMWKGTSDEEDVEAVRDATKAAQERGSGLLRPQEKRNAPEEIAAFREEFGALLSSMGRRLVVFVDNLDRCLPTNAIATLEAMRLFLFLPNTAFVVAADEEMIRLAVSKHFSEPGDRHVTDYLDKLIQIPIRVPKLGLQEVRAYLAMLAIARAGSEKANDVRDFLISKLRKSWSDEPPFEVKDIQVMLDLPPDDELLLTLEAMDRLAALLAHSVRINGNPRIVKRMLNVIRMRSAVAKRRGMALSEAFIAKLALFERCMGEEAIRDFSSLVNSAPDGKPALLTELETIENESLEARLPKTWQKHIDFVSDWLKLEPLLGGVDLRPAVYLSRETLPLRTLSAHLSPLARKAVGTLLKTVSMNSKASKDAIDQIPSEEMADVMDEIIVAMNRNPDWSRIRSDFRGAALLAKANPAGYEKLVRFLAGIPKKPAWMTAMMKDEDEPGAKRKA
ncbi:putative KAP-like P-loop ATPase [Aminobacter ciceronei]|uniref:KAP-like P-loop ATPase n=2 Tax=Aminobacter ciceronei TaxID=150723 RepID=A0ABR6C758_9HYPH|nr:putative KAP-like P-loop ATPase [Aminobacter ciceronei]MBA9020400.1 putative KAP-like P-loop ATPase [Aminobacter ciceronei]